jgi:hypothetical protein
MFTMAEEKLKGGGGDIDHIADCCDNDNDQNDDVTMIIMIPVMGTRWSH